jgi:hypothetical protein
LSQYLIGRLNTLGFEMHNKTYSLAVIFVFSFLLILPMLDMAFRFTELNKDKENRIRGQDIRAAAEGAPYSSKIEEKYNDLVGLRDLFISLHADIHLFYLKTGIRNIVIGTNGWFFEDLNGVKGTVAVEEIMRQLKRNEMLSGEALYLGVLMSRKNEVYVEYAPKYFNVKPLNFLWGGFNDQFMRINNTSNPALNIIDTKPVLIEGKQYGNTFFKKDGHWTPLGAYEVYRAIVHRIEFLLGADQFSPVPDNYFHASDTGIRRKASYLRSFGVGNILGNVDFSERYTRYEPASASCSTELHKSKSDKGFIYEATIINTCGSEKKILIIGSSFFEPTPDYGLARYLSQDFRTTIFARRQTAYTKPEQLEKLISQYKPDIIVDAIDLYR